MESLQQYRTRIDALDSLIVRTVAQRMGLCAEVAHFKRTHKLPMMQPQRVETVKDRAATIGEEVGLSRAFVTQLYSLIIGEACRLEDELMAAHHE